MRDAKENDFAFKPFKCASELDLPIREVVRATLMESFDAYMNSYDKA